MELKGEFKSYAEILDLLQIITMGKKSGEVNLRSDSQNISIFFKEGKVIDFTSNIPSLQTLRERVVNSEISLEEAINFLLHFVSLWNGGKFIFTEKPITNEGIGKADTLNIMMNFTKEEDELTEEVKNALSQNKKFILSERAKLPITIESEAWKLLVAICRGMRIWDALLKIGSSFSEDSQTLSKLIKNNLIEEKTEEEGKVIQEITSKALQEVSFVPPEKIEKVREVLVETMGPMGEFLIEETFDDMEVSKLPTNLVDKFIEKLLEKIPDSCLIDGERCRDRLKEELSRILGGEDEV